MKLEHMDFHRAGSVIFDLDSTPAGHMFISSACELLHSDWRTKAWWNSKASLKARNKLFLWLSELARGCNKPWPEREAPVETEDVFEAAGIAIEKVAKKQRVKASDMKNAASDDAFARQDGGKSCE